MPTEQYNAVEGNYSGSTSLFGHSDGAGPSNYRIQSPGRHSTDVQCTSHQESVLPRFSVDAGPSSSRQYSVPRRSGTAQRQSVHASHVDDGGLQFNLDEEEYNIEWQSDSDDDPDIIPSDDDDDVPVQQVPPLDLNEPASSSLYPVRMDMNVSDDLPRMEASEDRSLAFFVQCSNDVELKKGVKFDNKEEVIAAVKRYSISHHRNHQVTASKPDLFTAICKQHGTGCGWKIRAIKKWITRKWEITKYVEEHTCMAESLTTDHPQLDANLLSLEVEHLVRADITVRVRVLMEAINGKYRYMPSYRKTLMAKDRAIQRLYGQWDDSYNMLPQFFNALLAKNPRSIVRWHHYNHSPDGTSIVYAPEDTFQRVFWSFYPCIMAFKHCRPVLCIDATFLYGKYRGTLLIASGIDGGQQIIPVAYAIVENESEATWHWFLSNIRHHITQTRTLCVVSDRHAGIMNVMQGNRVWEGGEAHHRICARHLASNCVKNFKHRWLRGTITKLAYEYQPRKFEAMLQQLKIDSRECHDYITSFDYALWSAAFDGGARYGVMTTNIAESINGVMREVRQMPITSLVAATFGRTVQYFAERRTEYLDDRAAGHVFPRHVRDILKKRLDVSTVHRVTEYNRQTTLFSVSTGNMPGNFHGGHVQVVNLNQGECSCGKFQGFHIPCSHAIAACRSINLDYTKYVHRWYSLQMCLQTYTEQFFPLGDKAYWPEYRGRPLDANAMMIRNVKGRPRSTRFHNEMDWTSGEPRPITCTICGQTGHNRRTCGSRIR